MTLIVALVGLLVSQDAAPEVDPAPPATRVLFLHGGPSHGVGEHEYRAGCRLLAEHLERAAEGVKTELHLDWPADPSAFDKADSVVIFSDGGGRHPLVKRHEELAPVMARGCGLVCLHYAVEVPKGDVGEVMLDWIGGYFETHWSVNPHWKAKFTVATEHPIARGCEALEVQDEWYYHMRFRDEGVVPILSAVPPAHTLSRPDGPHSGNAAVREEVAAGVPQHVAWAYERADGGRGFGFTGLHFHHNLGHDTYRRLLLQAILWTANQEIPESGLVTTTPSEAELTRDLDR